MAHILVADDEIQIRELLKEILSMQGHAIDTAGDGREALQKIQAAAYELVIMDRNMPMMTGIEAITVIRANPKFKSLKILMFTSASITREIDEAFQAGADDYLLKPLNLKAIIDKVQATLSAPPKA